MATFPIAKSDLIEGMAKGMAVLESFDTERQRLNATQAAERAGLTRAAARRPAGLNGARNGSADDLKRIKGVGPKLEQLCHSLGFYHFDQIAGWTADEITWVDDNLEGFKGRVTRDDWVVQARILAAGGTTEFASRVDQGEVY